MSWEPKIMPNKIKRFDDAMIYMMEHCSDITYEVVFVCWVRDEAETIISDGDIGIVADLLTHTHPGLTGKDLREWWNDLDDDPIDMELRELKVGEWITTSRALAVRALKRKDPG